MMRIVFLSLLLLISAPVFAADYEVDLGIVLDLEDIRPLVDGCADIGILEDIRFSLDLVGDLEDLRSFLEDLGYVFFHGCPTGVWGVGIERTY